MTQNNGAYFKRIVKRSACLIRDISIDIVGLIVKTFYLLSKSKEDCISVQADHFDALRIQEKQQFERIVDRQNHKIKPEYIRTRNCPHCESNSYVVFFMTQDLFDYVKCKNCGFVYALQILTLETRRSLYGDVTGCGVTEVCCSPAEAESDIRRFTFPLKRIMKYRRSGTLLDVGSGVGNFLVQARECGFLVRGIETHVEFQKVAKSKFGIHVDLGLFEEMDLPENSFDVVTMWETLEHIHDPKSSLLQAFKILSPEGILAISVPNLVNLGFLLMREYSGHRGGEHINFFSPFTLSRMLADCGFKILEHHTTGNSNWKAIMNLLNLELDRIYCYENVGKENNKIVSSPFFCKAESLFLREIIIPFIAGWEQKTGRGSGILMLAQKIDPF